MGTRSDSESEIIKIVFEFPELEKVVVVEAVVVEVVIILEYFSVVDGKEVEVIVSLTLFEI